MVMRQHNIWCVYVRSVWIRMADCSQYTRFSLLLHILTG